MHKKGRELTLDQWLALLSLIVTIATFASPEIRLILGLDLEEKPDQVSTEPTEQVELTSSPTRNSYSGSLLLPYPLGEETLIDKKRRLEGEVAELSGKVAQARAQSSTPENKQFLYELVQQLIAAELELWGTEAELEAMQRRAQSSTTRVNQQSTFSFGEPHSHN